MRRIEEMGHRIEELAKDQGRPVSRAFSSRTPFTDDVMSAPAPMGFKMPAIPQYDGTTDPVDHLETFRTLMLLHGASDGFLCRAFPTTLTGAARDWEALQVPDLDPSAATNALLAGARSNDFRRAVARRNPHSLADLMSGAEEYISVEETLAALDSSRRRTSDDRNQDKPHAKQRRDDKVVRRDKSPHRREENFTPLNTSRRHILAAISGEEFIKWPTPMISKGNRRDKSKYCRFHMDHGHDTDDCRQLKEEIEQLIIRGYLKKYVRSDTRGSDPKEKGPQGRSPRQSQPPPVRRQSPSPPSPPPEAHGSQPRGVIGTIMGGPAAGGTSSAARKAYARRVNAVHTCSKKAKTENEISFSDADLDGLILPHDDALVLTMLVANWELRKILVDNGSSADILYYHAFERMMIGDDRLKPANSDLFGFSGEVVKVEGQIELPVLVGEPPCQAFAMKMKFITPNGVGEVRGDQPQSRECYAMALKGRNATESLPIELLDLRDEAQGTQPAEDLVPVPLCEKDGEKVVQIGSSLDDGVRHNLTQFLQDNADVFAWAPTDMPGINPEVSSHRLGVDPTCRPVKQKKRHFALERQMAIREEVERLLRADFIREIQYPDWLANVVLVKKANGKWRTCVDFTDLNKAFKGLKTSPWTEECQTSFEELKQYLSSPPLLTKPEPGEELILYLSISPLALAAVLVREERSQHKPVYYVSKALHDAEIRYQRVEKLAYALVMAARKLRPYFQAHTIKVLTDQPLRQVLHKPDTSGRLVKWAVELSEFDIRYMPRPALKAQVLADFVAECSIPQQIAEPEIAQAPAAKGTTTAGEPAEDEARAGTIPMPPVEHDPSITEALWEVHVDGSSNKAGCGAGLVLTGPDDFTLDYALRFGFRASNNEAEYEALLAGMNLAVQTGAQRLKAYCDSQLVANQIQGIYEARDERMIKYLSQVRQLSSKFRSFEVVRIPRTDNTKADVLSKLAASGYTTLGNICMEFLQASSIERKAAEIMQVEHEPCWMDEIVDYLRSGKLPETKREARKVIQRAARFSLDGENLFKRSYTLPYLKCLRPSDATYALQETHEGICGEHLGGKALAIKVLLRDELYHVLWAYRTTPRTPTGESPFNLSFGTEAVIPVDVGTPSARISNFNEQLNGDGLRANLDLLEDAREESRIRVAAYKQKVSRYHDSKIRPREFRVRDLVLRKAAISQPKKAGKLSPTWEGPYRVKEVIRPGSYRLETLEEQLLPHAWNSKNLRKYHQ
ncbi:uncharacterized protein LOC143876885 [Tasmannia lanceolata]|uniref:uncharacterized protein LOC143876885 n=2 Tax=Tasmannia lanceolata TaxID=3420 RepID=UPI0040647D9D